MHCFCEVCALLRERCLKPTSQAQHWSLAVLDYQNIKVFNVCTVGNVRPGMYSGFGGDKRRNSGVSKMSFKQLSWLRALKRKNSHNVEGNQPNSSKQSLCRPRLQVQKRPGVTSLCISPKRSKLALRLEFGLKSLTYFFKTFVISPQLDL